jgi:aspartyl-tRNA(Asn)/glutamyl-tRNA(Gln) amidotransferase subunit C
MVSIQEVEHVAKLARLSFSNAEKETLTHQLNDILKYMEQLNTLDTSNVEPLSHVIELSPDAGRRLDPPRARLAEGGSASGMFREDELKPCVSREDALKNAPAKSEKFFKVPKVIG